MFMLRDSLPFCRESATGINNIETKNNIKQIRYKSGNNGIHEKGTDYEERKEFSKEIVSDGNYSDDGD